MNLRRLTMSAFLVATCLAMGVAHTESASASSSASSQCAPYPASDLRGCNLSGKDLRNANLSHAVFGTRYIPAVTAIAATWSRKKHTEFLLDSEIYDIAGACGDVSWNSGMIERALCYNSMRRVELKYGDLLCKGSYWATDSIFNGDDQRSVFSSITVTCSKEITSGRKAKPARYIKSSLFKSNLSGANLSGASLSEVDLSGANLSGTNLRGADLSGVTSGRITGTPRVLPRGWKLIKGYLVGPKANLSKANLTRMNLSGVNLNGADLSGAVLIGVKSGGIQGVPKALPAKAKLINGYLMGPRVDLSGANLAGADLSDVDLTGALISKANLSEVSIAGLKSGKLVGQPSAMPTSVRLINGYLIGPGADLQNANFSSLDLRGVNLERANLTGADLQNSKSGNIVGVPSALPADWTIDHGFLFGPGANLIDADLTDVDLSNIDLSTLKVGRIVGTPRALPDTWIVSNGYLIGPGANLSGANLSGANLSDANLSNITSSNITGTPLALPPGWVLTQGYLIGPLANLTGANLTGADLTGADLAGANLTTVSSGLIQGFAESLPPDWRLVNGYLIGPLTNLSGANLSGANLSEANLSEANLSEANLSEANLSEANLQGSNINRTKFTSANLAGISSRGTLGVPLNLPTGWTYSGGYLIGAGAKLRGAQLPGINLSGADLHGADLTGANLVRANLESTNLLGADWSDADLSGANLRNAVLSTDLARRISGKPKYLPEGWSCLLIGGNDFLAPPGFSYGHWLRG